MVARRRSIAFTVLTPFYVLRAGTHVAANALVSGAGIIALLLGVKMATKYVGVRPLAGVFRMPNREAIYTTLLMSTGLTFGTISALCGLTHHAINQSQYTVLVTVVILSALVPTLRAQQFFMADVAAHRAAARNANDERGTPPGEKPTAAAPT